MNLIIVNYIGYRYLFYFEKYYDYNVNFKIFNIMRGITKTKQRLGKNKVMNWKNDFIKTV